MRQAQAAALTTIVGVTTRPLSRDESQERTRRLLLDAASELFARDGFRATSLADVATAAGFSKGAVYSNFASKEHLFLAAIEGEYARSLAELQPALATGGGMASRLQILGEWFADSIGGHPQRARATAEFALLADADPDVRTRLAEVRRMLVGVIESLLLEQQDQLGFAFRMPPRDLAQVVLALVDGLVIEDTFTPVSSRQVSAAMALLLTPA
jgi:AcrR family transcriptional regulator